MTQTRLGVVNDDLGQPSHMAGSEDPLWISLEFENWGWTDNTCAYRNHYRPGGSNNETPKNLPDPDVNLDVLVGHARFGLRLRGLGHGHDESKD